MPAYFRKNYAAVRVLNIEMALAELYQPSIVHCEGCNDRRLPAAGMTESVESLLC